MRDLFIVGAGGFGREAVWTVERINAASDQPLWHVIGFADDDPAKAQGNFEGYPLLGSVETASKDHPGASVFIAVGDSLSGHTTLGADVFMGTNSCTAPGLTVGEGARVACGTPVLANVPAGSTLSPFGTLKA